MISPKSVPLSSLLQTWTFSVFEGHLKALRDLQRTQQLLKQPGVEQQNIRDDSSIRTMSNTLQQRIATHRKE